MKMKTGKKGAVWIAALLAFVMMAGLAGCSSNGSSPGETTTESAAETVTEAAADVSSQTETTDKLSEAEEDSLEDAGEVNEDARAADLQETEVVPEAAEAEANNSNGVYVFVDDAQDFCFYVPAAYKDTAKTYGDGGAVVYTGDTMEGAPYYTINRYKTDKSAYVYALWEAMAIEDEYARYLAGGGVEPREMQAGNRTIYSVKADYLDPDSDRGMQEFIYVEQLTDGVIVYKTKYYTDDQENVDATRSAVELAMNYVCMSADYNPDQLGPNHIGIPAK